MDHRESIQNVIDYVEENTAEELTLRALADRAHMSSYHFARTFSHYTGMAPAAYVRRRRMVHAGLAIAGGSGVLQAAIGYGYDNHSAFSRAFKATLGLTPEACRRSERWVASAAINIETREIEGDDGGIGRSYETEHLRLRTFREDDWPSIQALALDRASSPTAHYDHQWPTGRAECRKIARGFSGSDSFWAVCRKDTARMIGIIVFNAVDANDALDFGHLFFDKDLKSGLIAEAIGRMVQYAFDELPIRSVLFHNAVAWPGQLEPLVALGFRKTGEGRGSFVRNARGRPVEFLGCTFRVTRSEWEGTANSSQGRTCPDE